MPGEPVFPGLLESPHTGVNIVVDASDPAYVTGETASTDFPTLQAFQEDQAFIDAFVAKIADN